MPILHFLTLLKMETLCIVLIMFIHCYFDSEVIFLKVMFSEEEWQRLGDNTVGNLAVEEG